MAFSIKDPEIDKNLRFLSSLTGESLTDAVGAAVAERIEKISRERLNTKNEKRKKLETFFKKCTPLNDSKYNHKKVTDELWGL